MRSFNNLFVSSGCPHCREVLPVVREINKKLPLKKRIKINNIRNERDSRVFFFPVIKKMRYQEGTAMDTPHLSLAKIDKSGKIVEEINIKGSYGKEIMNAFLHGYLNDEFIDEWKDSYEEELNS